MHRYLGLGLLYFYVLTAEPPHLPPPLTLNPPTTQRVQASIYKNIRFVDLSQLASKEKHAETKIAHEKQEKEGIRFHRC